MVGLGRVFVEDERRREGIKEGEFCKDLTLCERNIDALVGAVKLEFAENIGMPDFDR